MPVLNIEGRRVRVEDKFLQLSHEEQNKTVNEIASQLGIKAGRGNQQQPAQPAQPEQESWGQMIGGGLSSFGSGLTFGLTDYLPAAKEARKTFEKNHPIASTVTEVGGLLTPVSVPLKAVGAIAKGVGIGAKGVDKLAKAYHFAERARLGNVVDYGFKTAKGLRAAINPAVKSAEMAAKLTKPATIGSRVARSAAEGALGGALYSFNTADGGLDREGLRNRALSALWGGGFGAAGGAVAPAITSGASKLAGAFSKKVAVPTIDELKKKSSVLYKQAFDSGVEFKPSALQDFKKSLQPTLKSKGFIEKSAPKIYPKISGVMDSIDEIAKNPTSLQGMDTLRKVMASATSSKNKDQRHLAYLLMQDLDNFVNTAPVSSFTRPLSKEGIKTLSEARKNWHISAKADRVQRELDKIKSKLNARDYFDLGERKRNLTRQSMQKLHDKMNGLTVDEKAALWNAAGSSIFQKGLNLTGMAAPSVGGKGLLSALIAGGGSYALGGAPLSIALGTVGSGSKLLSNHLTNRKVDNALRLILAGGDKGNLVKPLNKSQTIIKNNEDLLNAVIRALFITKQHHLSSLAS